MLPKIRAILSWEIIPPDDSPDWSPIWGNVLDKYIQIKPKPWLSIIPIDYVKPEFVTILEADIEVPELIPIDIPDIPPPEGLNYTAFLPVDLDGLRQDCSLPKIGRIRAVLSWDQPPSTTDPDNLRHYGNRLDTHVQIKPAAPKALIERIGGVSVSQIDYSGNGKTIAGAQMMPSGSFADYWGAGSNLCPFGGGLYIVGKQFSSGKYRLKIRSAGNPADEQIIY